MPDETISQPVTDDLFVLPANDEIERLRDLDSRVEFATNVSIAVDDGEPVSLPESAMEALTRVLSYLASGAAVAIDPVEEVLTSQEAADLLGISRQYLTRLIARGDISVDPVETGRHRRIPLVAVRRYMDRLGDEAVRHSRQRRLQRRLASAASAGSH